MDMTMITSGCWASSPNPFVALLALLLLGVLGFFAARRWRWSVALVLPAALLIAWRWVSAVAGPLAEVPPEFRRYGYEELAVALLFSALALGLPLLGARRSRSRPAV